MTQARPRARSGQVLSTFPAGRWPTPLFDGRGLHAPAGRPTVALVLARPGDAARRRQAYRDFHHLNRDNFAYFDRKRVSLAHPGSPRRSSSSSTTASSTMPPRASFATCRWIDPNFVDLNDPRPELKRRPPTVGRPRRPGAWSSSSTRRSSTARLGATRCWSSSTTSTGASMTTSRRRRSRTTRVTPRSACACQRSWSARGSSKSCLHEVFEHTSLIKTILTRFAPDPAQAIAQMPPRVASSRHLGVVLEDKPRTDIPPPDDARKAIEDWRTAAREQRPSRPVKPPLGHAAPSPAPDGAGQPLRLHDFQEEFLKFALAMRHAGLPPGQP